MRRYGDADGSTGGSAAHVRASPELAAIVGAEPLTRADIVSRIWDYIKANDLQDPNDKRQIVADDTLARLFDGPRASMFDLDRHIARHLR